MQSGINFGKNAEIGDTKFSVKAKAEKLISNSFFAGYNINLGNSLVFGVENDFNFAKSEA
ncbi:hypothetical protein [Bartonella sp. DGB2]|uniref:hypothetical protein n=1 Tax=Bartonella sp. DGB2 TaxID=3388426 RepID=UPI00398F9BB7